MSTATDVSTAPPPRAVDAHGVEQRSHREILLVMSGLMVAMLLAMLDNTIIAPALPTIVGELGGLEHLAWVSTAYILGTAVSTPLWGKLGDRMPRKPVFMASIVVFVIGSALSGAAQTMDQLIGFRLLQGIGAGGILVGVMSVLAVLIPLRDRGRYMGYFMAIMPISMIGGPLVGGTITDHASWRWAFYVNVPLGILALIVVGATMHLSATPRQRARVDWPGALLMITWITGLILITTWGGTQYAWESPEIVGLSALVVVTFVAFLVVETRAADPVLPLGVFRNRNFSLAGGLSLVVGFALFGGITFLPQFQQFVQGASATNSGLLLLPMMVGVVISSVGSGLLVTRTGHYKIYPVIGTVLMTAGLALLATMAIDTSKTATGLYMLVLGLGMGLLFQTSMLIAQNSVEMKDIGAATAAATFLRSMGGAVGISVLGSLYAHEIGQSLDAGLGVGNPVAEGSGLSPEVVRALPGDQLAALQGAIVDGIVVVFAWSALITVIGIVCAVFIRQVPLRGSAR
ncbi:MAG: MDR family MFS transporter [Sporichthyaceae bacterium]